MKANPWLVIQRAMRTPMAASFSRPTQTPVSPSTRSASDAVVGRCSNQDVFEVADVPVHIATVRLEIDDGIPDDLSGPVISDVAAAAGLVDFDAARRQRVCARQDVRPPAVAAHAQGQDVRMLDEQQRVGNPVCTPILHQRALQGERLAVRHQAETPDLEWPRNRTHARPTCA